MKIYALLARTVIPAGEVEIPEERLAVAIRNQLRGMLGTLQREQSTWRERFDTGEVEPAMSLLERYPEHDIKHDAIRSLIEGKRSWQAAQAFWAYVNTLQYHRREADNEPAQAYGCTV